MSFPNSRGLRLAANYFPASSLSIVVMAHGFGSDKSSRGRFCRIARRLNEEGWAALAFDFSGCGESDDDTLTVVKEIDDLRAAVGHALALGHGQVALWGHSLGSRICLEANPSEAVTMVLTGAATGAMRYRWEDYYSAEQLHELSETGLLTERRSDGLREKLVIETRTLQDFADFDQVRVLGAVRCPVLLIHGDSRSDTEELELLEHSRRGLRYLPAGSRLEVIRGASHNFMDHLDQVVALGVSWLGKYLPREEARE